MLADKTGNARAELLGRRAGPRDRARVLEEGRSPSRRVGELDNRGSHFYLALYWAQELAAQTEDAELAARFAPLAERLAEDEATIVAELDGVQGEPVDLGGYFRPDPAARRGGDAPERDAERGAGRSMSCGAVRHR